MPKVRAMYGLLNFEPAILLTSHCTRATTGTAMKRIRVLQA
jgi:hypothetical protein